jgi:hypothetical protein
MSNAASTTDAAPKRDWVTHAVLLLGVVVFALPIWIVRLGIHFRNLVQIGIGTQSQKALN